MNPEKRDAYDSTGLSTFHISLGLGTRIGTSYWKTCRWHQRIFKDLDLIIQFQSYSLRSFYQQQHDPFVVGFYAPWCSHCLDAAPAIRSLAISLDAENSKVKVGAVNCEQYAVFVR